jgi:hypothetical protein
LWLVPGRAGITVAPTLIGDLSFLFWLNILFAFALKRFSLSLLLLDDDETDIYTLV